MLPHEDDSHRDDPAPPMTEEWLRAAGHILAADERARQKRLAGAALDELLARSAA